MLHRVLDMVDGMKDGRMISVEQTAKDEQRTEGQALGKIDRQMPRQDQPVRTVVAQEILYPDPEMSADLPLDLTHLGRTIGKG